MALLQQIEAIKDLLQESVERGSRMVEGIHQVVEDTIVQTVGLEDQAAVQAYRTRVAHIYESIRLINQKLGDAASEIFEVIEDQAQVDKIVKEKQKLD
ncbi:MAG: hypothetical protein HKM02_07650 [Pseudomonadales bacterium]|nr:hypothetical protein [Pseudomonadales bacterium]